MRVIFTTNVGYLSCSSFDPHFLVVTTTFFLLCTINTLMKNMAKAVGLDVTNKHYTNHSIHKIILQKLKKVVA